MECPVGYNCRMDVTYNWPPETWAAVMLGFAAIIMASAIAYYLIAKKD